MHHRRQQHVSNEMLLRIAYLIYARMTPHLVHEVEDSSCSSSLLYSTSSPPLFPSNCLFAAIVLIDSTPFTSTVCHVANL